MSKNFILNRFGIKPGSLPGTVQTSRSDRHKNKNMQYENIGIVRKAFGDYEFIGEVSANSIKELKEAARKHARSWNKHGHRLILDMSELDMADITINS